jgi:hypothetical protein
VKLPAHIYHLAEADNWPRIQREGLLSASRLLDAARVSGADRERLERRQRPRHTVLSNGVAIRDQLPMPASTLAKCLRGMTPAEWYTAINARVFFWVDPLRMERQRKACGVRPQVVLTIDARALAFAHAARAAVTPFNTGYALRRPAPRGRATFVPYAEWLRSGWASEAAALGLQERPRSHVPAELTVLDAVPDILRYVVDVDETWLEPVPKRRAVAREAT